MNEINYNIGLDIGTTSVGWAVVNPATNKVIKRDGKQLWGVRLFEEATPASVRRNFRSTRRRFDRRRKRVKLLQEMFYDEIMKIDKNFFTKMKESFYASDDDVNKTIKISQEEIKGIKRYYEKYPTIYHLRKHLMETDEKEDIRLVYLAIHHIIKYRGNFLYGDSNFNISNLDLREELENLFERFYNECEEISFNALDISEIDCSEVSNSILFHTKNDKKVLLKKVLQPYVSKEFLAEFTKMIIGNQFSIRKLFNIDLDEDIEIKFQGSVYEEKRDSLEKVLQDRIEILDSCKNIYDMIFLKEMFKGKENCNLSFEMVDRYKTHKDDLKYLKKLFKYDDELYKKMFKSKKDKNKDKLCVYDLYTHNQLAVDEFRRELKNFLAKLLEKVDNQPLIDKYNLEVKDRIENGDFLPRITDVDNGKFPYQLNLVELRKIIENQGKYYPFLLEKYSDKEYKLERLLSFRIPYYVGPLNNTTDDSNRKNKNAWLVKKSDVKMITPYNFEEVIDKEKTAEEFITRMISHCTYLLDEYAMPSNSILYSKFKVMNELKQIKINDQRLPIDVQKKIIEELFMRREGNITDKVFRDYIISHNLFPMYDRDFKVTGYSSDKGFANNMASYVFFFGENGIFNETEYKVDDAENIIRWMTIFEDKSILESKVRNTYPKLTDQKIKKIISKRYSGWSSLSEKLLTTKYYLNKENSTYMSILDLLEEENENFMQILNNNKYKFQKMIDSFNNVQNVSKVNYSLVDNLATSPATKRGIYQALKVVEEIVKYMGCEPNNIMIEMARGEEKKKRTERRKDYLTNLYNNNNKSQINDYERLADQLSKLDKIDSEKLFLYFIQEGKSLYSMKPIDIEELFTEKYEVDHIIPRSLIKNDSIDNKALVLRIENQEKAGSFVLPAQFRNEYTMRWWGHLKNIGLISSKKYNSLIRYKYSDDDIKGFINRQLVETRQITKHVANILGNLYKKSKVVYLHANLSHNYREKFELYKYRELNDHHHAHDAYLAAVIGNFTENYLKEVNFEKLKEVTKRLYDTKQYNKLNYGYVINSMDSDFLYDEDTGEVKFDIDRFNKTVSDTLYNNYDIRISKKTEIKTGEFYNQTKSKKGNPGMRLKDNLPTEKYGSYTSLNASYTVMVKWVEKDKEKQRLVGIPIYVDVKSRSNPSVMNEYLHNLLKLDECVEIEIVKNHIPFNQVLNLNGKMCYLTGASSVRPYVDLGNSKQFIIDKKHLIEWRHTLNKLLNNKNYCSVTDEIYGKQLDDIIRYILEKMEREYSLFIDFAKELKDVYFINGKMDYTLSEKEKFVKELFNLLKCDEIKVSLKDFGLVDNYGRTKNRAVSNVRLINKSITGLWEKEFEL